MHLTIAEQDAKPGNHAVPRPPSRASCQISLLSQRPWEIALLSCESAAATPQLLECIEFPGLCHIVIMAESSAALAGRYSLDLLRGVIAVLGMQISELDILQASIRKNLLRMITPESLPAATFVKIPADGSALSWITSKTRPITHIITHGDSAAPPDLVRNGTNSVLNLFDGQTITLLSSFDSSLSHFIKNQLERSSETRRTIEVMESVRELLESSNDPLLSTTVLHIRKAPLP